uniref:Uncharacterized protein n=1 Tax=Nymphaea colorata TaxID=210225 RepID=A0A5K0YTX4_9MAGN|nr:unnamed protein product [Nymphaea colorata]
MVTFITIHVTLGTLTAPSSSPPPPLAVAFLSSLVISIRTPPDGIGEAIDPHLELIILVLEPPPVLDEVLVLLELGRVTLLGEVAVEVPGLDVVLPAERDPHLGEHHCLRHGLEREEAAAVFGDVAGELLDGVIGGENGVGCHKGSRTCLRGRRGRWRV